MPNKDDSNAAPKTRIRRKILVHLEKVVAYGNEREQADDGRKKRGFLLPTPDTNGRRTKLKKILKELVQGNRDNKCNSRDPTFIESVFREIAVDYRVVKELAVAIGLQEVEFEKLGEVVEVNALPNSTPILIDPNDQYMQSAFLVAQWNPADLDRGELLLNKTMTLMKCNDKLAGACATLAAFLLQKGGNNFILKHSEQVSKIQYEIVRSPAYAPAITWNLAKVFNKIAIDPNGFGSENGLLLHAGKQYMRLDVDACKTARLDVPVPLTGALIDLPFTAIDERMWGDPLIRDISPPWRYQVASSIILSSTYSARQSHLARKWLDYGTEVLNHIGNQMPDYSVDAKFSYKASKIMLRSQELIFLPQSGTRKVLAVQKRQLSEDVERYLESLNSVQGNYLSRTRMLENSALIYSVKANLVKSERARLEAVELVISVLEELQKEVGAKLYFLAIDPIYKRTLGEKVIQHFAK